MQSATFQLHEYTDYMSRILNRNISQMCCHIVVHFLGMGGLKANIIKYMNADT